DAKDFGGRGLLLQGLARFGDQPRVLNSDDRLCSEILEQCQFCVGKRAHFEAAGDNLTEQSLIFAQRYKGDGSDAAEFGAQPRNRIIDRGHIAAVSDPRPIDETAARVVGPRDVALPYCLHHWLWEAAHRDAAELLAIPELQAATDGAAQRVRLF